MFLLPTYVLVRSDELKRSGDLFGRGATTNVEKVGRLATVKLERERGGKERHESVPGPSPELAWRLSLFSALFHVHCSFSLDSPLYTKAFIAHSFSDAFLYRSP